jgi:hypothetical protein
MEASLYEQRGRFLHAGELTRGPWDAQAQHGGPPAAILIRAFEALADNDLQFTRVTYELMRPVPLGDLFVEAAVIRPGRRVQLLEGAISTPDGVEVMRARALRVARAPVTAGGPARPPAGPEATEARPFSVDWSPTFPGDGIEVRFAAGSYLDLGPATAWFRLRVPLVGGEKPSALQRLASAADFANGIATELPWSDFVFINPDLTIYIEREPRGEWICLDARMRVTDGGGAVSEAVLYDLDGRVGRALQSLYVARR